jgi:hypothetical protein
MQFKITSIFLLSALSLHAFCGYEIEEHNGRFYTQIKTNMKFDEAKMASEQLQGRLAIPRDQTDIEFFVKKGWGRSWIGVYDPMRSKNFCHEDEHCLPDPSRFRTITGSPVAFTNWAQSEPDNHTYDYDIENGKPNVEDIGEHWAMMAVDGKWYDMGNHIKGSQNPVKHYAIVEFVAKPACYEQDDNETVIPTEIFCVKDIDGDGDISSLEKQTCSDTKTGGYICPIDMVLCEPTYMNPACSNGGRLNEDRDMCQFEIDRAPCGLPGYTFDAPSDTCAMPVTCVTSGHNGSPSYGANQCRFEQYSVCPSGGFTLTGSICKANPTCSQGSYVSSNKRCERNADTYQRIDVSGRQIVNYQGAKYYDTKPSFSPFSFTVENYRSKFGLTYINTSGGETHMGVALNVDICNRANGVCVQYVVAGSNNYSSNFPTSGGTSYMSNPVVGNSVNGESYVVLDPGSYSVILNSGSYPTIDARSSYCRGSVSNPSVKKCSGSDWNQYGFLVTPVSACPNGGALGSGGDFNLCYVCPSGYTLANGKCHIAPSCPSGSIFNAQTEKCEISAALTCPSGSTLDSATGKCVNTIDCKGGVLDVATQRCVIPDSDPSAICPSGYQYAYQQGTCELAPYCALGQYDNTANSCFIGNLTCPFGSEFACQTPVSDNRNYCSPNKCIGAEDIIFNDTTTGENDKTDDAWQTDGTCGGNIYIFNGKDSRCTHYKIFNENCCKESSIYADLMQCKGSDKMTAAKIKRDACHEVGDYCVQDVLGSGCIVRKHTYCCFDGILSRIIHEQGRPQVSAYYAKTQGKEHLAQSMSWGEKKSPNCRGFTPEEFQMIDFSLLNLDEYANQLSADIDMESLMSQLTSVKIQSETLIQDAQNNTNVDLDALKENRNRER